LKTQDIQTETRTAKVLKVFAKTEGSE